MKFPPVEAVIAIHNETLARDGGVSGIRDYNVLESAVMSPQMAVYYKNVDVVEAAAYLLYALATNHAFTDGNKRTALGSALMLLGLNGYLTAVPLSAPDIVEAVADDRMTREELIQWMQTAFARKRRTRRKRTPS